MDIYTSEQEQVEAIKKWLKENGVPIVVGLMLGLGGISGWRYWQAHKEDRAEAASALFAQVTTAIRSEQTSRAGEIAKQVVTNYGDTTYAAFAALTLAKLAVQEQDLPSATQHLEWVLEHSKQESLRRIARMRMARVLLAAGKPGEAWAQLEKLPAADPSAALAELRGDVLLAQGSKDGAGQQYLKAYANAEPQEQHNESGALALKLGNLGIAPSGGAIAARQGAP
ncbi:MAG: YfgM family protein [Chromatiales bacterium]